MSLIVFNNPYHVPKVIYQLLNEIEVLLKNLNLKNRESTREEILFKLNQIFTNLKSIERDLERFTLCSNTEIARFQVLIEKISAFRAIVGILFANQNFKKEAQIRELQIELERRFRIILQIITRKMIQLEPVIKRQQQNRLTYH